MNKLKKLSWYWYIVIGILFIEILVFSFFGENSYLGIHDNLDIHIADYQVLKLNNAFFSYEKKLPILGGLDRNYFLPEWSLYAFLYMIFPNFTAYIIGYFLKILISLFSGILLGKDLLREKYKKYEWLVVLSSFTYGLLPLYPAFSFCFASLPLLVHIVISIMNQKGKRYYFYIFLYPMLSYFSFFGIILIGYLCLFTIFISFKKRLMQKNLLLSIFFLSLGYATMEHRLFIQMLFSNEETIRTTMVMESQSASGILKSILQVFYQGIFHATDMHQYIVLPVCLLVMFLTNIRFIIHKEYSKIVTDKLNLIMLFILANSIIYGLQNSHIVRSIFYTIVPPLDGWQFNRTFFFNPFLWYLAICIVIFRICESNHKKIAVTISLFAMLMPIMIQSGYNDFYNTLYINTYNFVKEKKSETLSYKEFYSSELFSNIKNHIDYNGEYAVAYGFHPAVLSYNGISTLDACFSYYPQEYKDKFREVIAPCLNKSESSREYYDNWAGRAYIFSDTIPEIWNPVRTMCCTESELCIDSEAFKQLGGKYIFSRIDISNDKELGLDLIGTFEHTESPYTIWVWKKE